METLYYPASNLLRDIVRKDHPTPLAWTDPRTDDWPDKCPAVLISYHYYGGDRTDFVPRNTVFGDSGGFSILTLGAQIAAEDVIRWQLKNCTVGAILDVPPIEGLDWDECLRKTLINVEKALPLYLGGSSDFRWWSVLQGETHELMQDWYDRIADVYPFDREGEGWAIKPPRTYGDSAAAVANSLAFVARQGIRRIHLLGITSLSALAALFVLGPRAGVDYASFDSSAADALAARSRTLLVPSEDGLSLGTLSERREADGEAKGEAFMRTCPCSSCHCLREDYPDEAPADGTYIPKRMLTHNVLTFKRVSDNLKRESLAHPDEFLKDRLGKLHGPTLRAFEGQQPRAVKSGTPRSLLDML